ncbi:MAG: MATE family efflux transporter [Clostridia bacterium]|nr:MATE family efflux transporter [Clostridia bacterium]
MAEMVLMSLIGTVDLMMVGSLGSSAIASVGLTGQPRMIVLSMFMALNVGVTAIVARRKGEGRKNEANSILRNGLMLVVFLSLVMGFLAVSLRVPLMRLAGGNESTPYEAKVLFDAADYFGIMMMALPLNAMTLCINAAQRGIGNTRTTLAVNMTSNLVNVVCNYLLIGGNLGFPALGVRGAALASVIGISVGFVMALITICFPRHGRDFLRLRLTDDWRLHKNNLYSIFRIGGNAMLEQIALRIGFFIHARLVFGLGAEVYASHQIVIQFMTISFTFGDGIGVAGTSLVGQMLGKKRPDMAMIYGKVCQRMALLAAAILFIVMSTFRYQLVGLFVTPEEQHVAELAAQVMIVLCIILPIQNSAVVLSGCLRGAGDTKFVAKIMMLSVMIVRPVCTFLAVSVFKVGLVGAWISSLIDIALRQLTSYLRFSHGQWTKIRV